MEWSKIKTVIILFLLVVNVFFLVLLEVQFKNNYLLDNDSVDNMVKVLGSDGIKIDPSINIAHDIAIAYGNVGKTACIAFAQHFNAVESICRFNYILRTCKNNFDGLSYIFKSRYRLLAYGVNLLICHVNIESACFIVNHGQYHVYKKHKDYKNRCKH